jgi:L-amino acid N-acyltransferase YncA
MSDLPVRIRSAHDGDMTAIARIYNQGIEDRIATLETDTKSEDEVRRTFAQRADRYDLIVAHSDDHVLGWASLNPYSHRCAYDGVADLSVYVEREARGTGIGRRLMDELEKRARARGFHKLILFTLPFNVAGQRLYRNRGFREVGTFKQQGTLDGRFVDVMAMEKILEA